MTQLYCISIGVFLILTALLIVFVESSIHAIIYLMGLFCLLTGLGILFGMEFLSLIFVILYIGAVCILMLFHIKLIKTFIPRTNSEENENFLIPTIGFIIILPILLLISLLISQESNIMFATEIAYQEEYESLREIFERDYGESGKYSPKSKFWETKEKIFQFRLAVFKEILKGDFSHLKGFNKLKFVWDYSESYIKIKQILDVRKEHLEEIKICMSQVLGLEDLEELTKKENLEYLEYLEKEEKSYYLTIEEINKMYQIKSSKLLDLFPTGFESTVFSDIFHIILYRLQGYEIFDREFFELLLKKDIDPINFEVMRLIASLFTEEDLLIYAICPYGVEDMLFQSVYVTQLIQTCLDVNSLSEYYFASIFLSEETQMVDKMRELFGDQISFIHEENNFNYTSWVTLVNASKNTSVLGTSIYIYGCIHLIVGAFLLLVAMFGSILITSSNRKKKKFQKLDKQIFKEIYDSIFSNGKKK